MAIDCQYMFLNFTNIDLYAETERYRIAIRMMRQSSGCPYGRLRFKTRDTFFIYGKKVSCN